MKYFKKGAYLVLVAILIFSLSLTGCGGGGGTGGTGDDDVIEWSFYSAYGPDEGVCCQVWRDLFAQIEEETDGRLVITPYWYGQHPYEGEDMLKALEDGACEIAHFYSGYLSAVEPVFAVDALPLIFPQDPMESWGAISTLWGDFEQDPNGVLEGILQDRWNATMVHMMPASPQRFFTVGYRIDGLGSLKGHKLRVYSPELGQLVEILGGTPVSVAFSEVYTSLSTNLIDGYVTSTMFADSGGLFDFTDTINAWEIMASADGVVASMDALESLPDDIREIFLKVMHDSATKPESIEIEINDQIVKDRVASGKVEFYQPTEEKRNEVIEVVKEKIWPAWLKLAGEDGNRALKQIGMD